MLDDTLVFSQIQPITVSVASNYPGTQGPSPGVYDTIGVVPSRAGRADSDRWEWSRPHLSSSPSRSRLLRSSRVR